MKKRILALLLAFSMMLFPCRYLPSQGCGGGVSGRFSAGYHESMNLCQTS